MVLRDERNGKHDAATRGEVLRGHRVEDAARVAAPPVARCRLALERDKGLRHSTRLVEAPFEEERLEPEAEKMQALRAVGERRERKRAVEELDRVCAVALLDEERRCQLGDGRGLHEPKRVVRVRHGLRRAPEHRERAHEQAMPVA